jgi:hypothetical protein
MKCTKTVALIISYSLARQVCFFPPLASGAPPFSETSSIAEMPQVRVQPEWIRH